MTVKDVTNLADTVTPVLPGTPAMEALVGSGYGMSLEDAEMIIKERDKNPMAHSFGDYKKAKAFIQAYKTKSTAVSTRAGWKRSQGKP